MFKYYVESMLNHRKFEADKGSSGASGASEEEPKEPEDEQEDDDKDEKKKERLFNRKELGVIVSQEVEKALETERLNREKEEAKAKSRENMTEDERRAAELADKETEITRKEIRLNYREKIQEDGLSIRALDLIDCNDDSKAEASYKLIKEVFNEMNGDFNTKLADGIKKGVEERLKGSGINTGNSGASLSIGAQLAKERNERKKQPEINNPWGK